VLEAGESDTEPDVAPPVENPVPAQEPALALLQLRSDELPETMDAGFATRLAVGASGTLAEAVNITEQFAMTAPVL
jgi:hypothetical protein